MRVCGRARARACVCACARARLRGRHNGLELPSAANPIGNKIHGRAFTNQRDKHNNKGHSFNSRCTSTLDRCNRLKQTQGFHIRKARASPRKGVSTRGRRFTMKGPGFSQVPGGDARRRGTCRSSGRARYSRGTQPVLNRYSTGTHGVRSATRYFSIVLSSGGIGMRGSDACVRVRVCVCACVCVRTHTTRTHTHTRGARLEVHRRDRRLVQVPLRRHESPRRPCARACARACACTLECPMSTPSRPCTP